MAEFQKLYAIRVPFPDESKYTFIKNCTGELEYYTTKEKALEIATRYPEGQPVGFRIRDWNI